MKMMAVAAALSMVIAACGNDSGGSGEDTGGPGQVQIAVNGVTGATTQILLLVIHEGNPERPLGAACAVIDDDLWGFTGPVYPIEGDDPCSLGTTPVVFAPGTYAAYFGVYTGGERTADQCVEIEFEVAGDTTVTAPALVAPCDLYN